MKLSKDKANIRSLLLPSALKRKNWPSNSEEIAILQESGKVKHFLFHLPHELFYQPCGYIPGSSITTCYLACWCITQQRNKWKKIVTINKEQEAPLVHQEDHTAQSSPAKQKKRKKKLIKCLHILYLFLIHINDFHVYSIVKPSSWTVLLSLRIRS